MVISAGLLLTLMSSLISNDADAGDAVQEKGTLAEINIRLSGNIVALACTEELADVDKTVSLGECTTKQLHYSSDHEYFRERLTFYRQLSGQYLPFRKRCGFRKN